MSYKPVEFVLSKTGLPAHDSNCIAKVDVDTPLPYIVWIKAAIELGGLPIVNVRSMPRGWGGNPGGGGASASDGGSLPLFTTTRLYVGTSRRSLCTFNWKRLSRSDCIISCISSCEIAFTAGGFASMSKRSVLIQFGPPMTCNPETLENR